MALKGSEVVAALAMLRTIHSYMGICQVNFSTRNAAPLRLSQAIEKKLPAGHDESGSLLRYASIHSQKGWLSMATTF
jgi:hypothetical protein